MIQTEVIVVLGQRGCGKTTMARGLFQQAPRALAVEAGFGELGGEVFYDLKSCISSLDRRGAFSDLSRLPSGQACFSYVPFRVSCTPRPEEWRVVFALSCSLGNVLLVLDEADRFGDSRHDPDYNEVVSRGRHYGVSVVAVGLRATKLPRDLRSQCTRLISFRQIDPDDIKAVSEVIGKDAWRLSQLYGPGDGSPPYGFMDWRASSGAVFKGISFPAARAQGIWPQ